MLWPYALGSETRSERARIDGWVPPGALKLERHVIDVPVDPATALAALGRALHLRKVSVGRRYRSNRLRGLVLGKRGEHRGTIRDDAARS